MKSEQETTAIPIDWASEAQTALNRAEYWANVDNVAHREDLVQHNFQRATVCALLSVAQEISRIGSK